MIAHLTLGNSAVPWENLSVGVAALLVMVYIVREMRRTLRDTMAGVSERQTEMLTWFGNHLSNVSSSLEATALSMQKLTDEVAVLHEDNLETAVVLRDATKEAFKEQQLRSHEHLALLQELRYGRMAQYGARAEGDVEAHHIGERGE